MTVIYRDLVASEARTCQVITYVTAAFQQGRNCLVLTSWIAPAEAGRRAAGHDPVVLRGGMGVKDRDAALARLRSETGGPPLLVVGTGPYAAEGFDCSPLDTLFLAAPVSYQGKLVQYAGRSLRPYDGKTTAEVHDYVDERTGVLASWLLPSAHPAMSAWAFPIRDDSLTHPAPRRARRDLVAGHCAPRLDYRICYS
jgi:superfamily II DNA or RNA helicase